MTAFRAASSAAHPATLWAAPTKAKFEPHEEGDYFGAHPPEGLFADVARRVGSRFFTMDVAQRKGGGWMIVELGDGQVAGLPGSADVVSFYRRLKDAVPRGE